ncbi:UNVERIFIED_CONTAM: hypothetical protein LK11_13760 [Mumia flava]
MDDDLLRAFGDEVMRISRRRVSVPAGSVLDPSAYRILWSLVDHGPLGLGELGEELQLEQSTVSRQVKAAVRHGLVERVITEGTRQRVVRATAAGEEAYWHDARLRGERFRQALGELGAEHVRVLAADLRAFNDALDRARAADPDA